MCLHVVTASYAFQVVELVVAADADAVEVEIRFLMDYETFVQNETEFISIIKPQLASAMGIEEDRLVNFNVYEGNIFALFVQYSTLLISAFLLIEMHILLTLTDTTRKKSTFRTTFIALLIDPAICVHKTTIHMGGIQTTGGLWKNISRISIAGKNINFFRFSWLLATHYLNFRGWEWKQWWLKLSDSLSRLQRRVDNSTLCLSTARFLEISSYDTNCHIAVTSDERHRDLNHCQFACLFYSFLKLNWETKLKQSITGPLWGESTGHQWIPLTKGQWCLVVIFRDCDQWITLTNGQ